MQQIRIFLLITASMLFPIAGIAQDITPKDDGEREPFSIVASDRSIVMLNRETGETWRLEHVPKSNAWFWVPLKKFDNERAAQEWIENLDEQEQREVDREKLQAWVETLLLSSEIRDNRPAVRRWTIPPTVSVFGADPEQKNAVISVVTRLNQIFAKANFGAARLIADEDSTANLRVYFVDTADAEGITRQEGFDFEAGNLGSYFMRWNNRHEIHSAIVLLDKHRLTDETLRHFAFEEITQSFGVLNDSPLIRDSIFYSQRGGPTELNGSDARIVQFLYEFLRPGHRRTQLRAEFKRNWEKTGEFPQK